MRLWILAIAITLAAAVYQRMSGPTYPVKGKVSIGGQTIHYRLTRSHGGTGDQPVEIEVPDPVITGDLSWRRYPTQEEGLAMLTQPGVTGAKLKKLPNDPWGHPYRYVVPGENGQPYAVISTGADGEPGGDGENADLRSDVK